MNTVHLVPAPPPAAFTALAEALARAGTPSHALTPGGPAWLARPRTARDIRRLAPDAVIAWSPEALALIPRGPWRVFGRPAPHHAAEAFAGCHGLIASTPAEARRLTRTRPPSDIQILPDIVPDLAGAPPAPLPVPAGAPIILSLGRLTKANGMDVLIAALTRLPTAHAVIAGEGPEQRALQALARQAGLTARIHFLPTPANPAGLLAAATMLASPARADTYGAAIRQAFAAGTPVIATMTEAALDLMSDGAKGILVPADSGIALAAGLEGMLASPAMAQTVATTARIYHTTHHAAAPVMSAWGGWTGGA